MFHAEKCLCCVVVPCIQVCNTLYRVSSFGSILLPPRRRLGQDNPALLVSCSYLTSDPQRGYLSCVVALTLNRCPHLESMCMNKNAMAALWLIFRVRRAYKPLNTCVSQMFGRFNIKTWISRMGRQDKKKKNIIPSNHF